MAYTYTDGDGLTALVKTEPAASDSTTTADEAIRQIKAYLRDATGGGAKIRSDLDTAISDIDALEAAFEAAFGLTTVRAFSARKAVSSQGFTGNAGYVKVTFEAEDSDPASMYDAGNGKFTAPISGYCIFNCTLQINPPTGSPTSIGYSLGLYMNGSLKELEIHSHDTPAAITTVRFSTIIPVTAAQYFEIYVKAEDTGDGSYVIADTPNTKFQVSYL